MPQIAVFSGFHRLTIAQRIEKLSKTLGHDCLDALVGESSLSDRQADQMIENALGTFRVPIGVLPELRVNGKLYTIPLVTEEASVIAGANKAAKCINAGGGILTHVMTPYLWGHVQLLLENKQCYAEEIILENSDEILKQANASDPQLLKAGGGAKELKLERLEANTHDRCSKNFLIVSLRVETIDAMGANAVNTMLESIRPMLEKLLGVKSGIAILSNDGSGRLVEAELRLPFETLPLEKEYTCKEAAERLVCASAFAERSSARALTHNKGIMNGVSALAMALGQDTRAIEAAAHAYACREGGAKPLSSWVLEEEALCAKIKIPIVMGIVGGSRRKNPSVEAAFSMIACEDYAQTASLFAAIGLCSNFAALWALSTSGIQRGHMALHLR